MKFYVPESSRTRSACAAPSQRCIEAAGHEITHDWTMAEALGGPDEARDDMDGVKDADALLFVNVDPDLLYAGSLVEIGMALALDKPVYFINTKHMTRNIFFTSRRLQRRRRSAPHRRTLAEEFGAVMNGVATEV